MALVNSDFLNNVLWGFQGLFRDSFEAEQNLQPWREIVTIVKSTGDTESLNWLGSVPQMEDVTHTDPKIEGLRTFQYNIQNREFEAVIEVRRSTLEDDKLGLIAPRVRQLAQEAARHPGQLVFQLPVTNGNAFDSTAFIADTRVIGGSANIDNNMASGGSGTTLAGFQADLATARATMRAYQDDQGRPMNKLANAIMVPPQLEQLAYQALSISFPAASPNVGPIIPATVDGALRINGYLVIVNPFLTDANDWYLMHVGAGDDRPFIYQERVAPTFEALDNPNSETAVIRRKYLYAARARYEVGYGDPRNCIRIVN